MSRSLIRRFSWVLGIVVSSGIGGCSSDHGGTGAPSSSQASSSASNASTSSGSSGSVATDGGSDAGAVLPGNWTYVLIDDMETTTHGPIELDAGIAPPLTPGYWYNSGAQVGLDGGSPVDMSDPPQGAFVFTALPKPTTTLDGKVSKNAARQHCVLWGLYDTCGVGFEYAQEPLLDAGTSEADAAAADATTDASANVADAGDAGPPVPRATVPFDISRYRGITFWGMTTTPDSTGSLMVKVQFPDPDTDPRGNVCNGGSLDYTKCYNSYAAYVSFTTSWQQFVVWLDAGDGGGPPDGGISIDPSWGYQSARWLPTQVYGTNWQAQKNTDVDAGSLTTEIWVDDVYFFE